MEEEEEEEEPTPIATSSSSSSSSSKLFPAVGFANVGNTCYFNSALQATLCAVHYYDQQLRSDEILALADIPVTSTFL